MLFKRNAMQCSNALASSTSLRNHPGHNLRRRSHLGHSHPAGRSSPLACDRHTRHHRRGGHGAPHQSLAGEAHRHRRNHQACDRRQMTLLHPDDVHHRNRPHDEEEIGDHRSHRQSRMSRLRIRTILDDRSLSSLAGDRGLRIRTPPGGHIQTILAGGCNLSFRGVHHKSSPADDRNRIPLGGHSRSYQDVHRNLPGSPHHICAPVRNRWRHETGCSLQSGAWEMDFCSSCACAPARESANDACARRNLNDACQHRHPSLRHHYHISSCSSSSLLSHASCAPSSDASRTNLRRPNRRRRPNRLSWIYGTYHGVCSTISIPNVK